MSKKIEDLDTTMTREVKAIYFAQMGNSYSFIDRPFLDEAIFRDVYARVAHRNSIRYHKGVLCLNQEQQDDRRRYVIHYRVVRRRLQRAIKLLGTNRLTRIQPAKVRPPVTPTPRTPEQLWLRGFTPPSPIPPHIKEKLDRLRTR